MEIHNYLWRYSLFTLCQRNRWCCATPLSKCPTERRISMSMIRLCPCADNDVISLLNHGLIFPRRSNMLYFVLLCAPSVLFVVPLWSPPGFSDIVWPVIAVSSGLNDSDRSLVLCKTFLSSASCDEWACETWNMRLKLMFVCLFFWKWVGWCLSPCNSYHRVWQLFACHLTEIPTNYLVLKYLKY